MMLEETWISMQTEIKSHLGVTKYGLWITPMKPVIYGDNWILFETPNSFFDNFIKKEIWPVINSYFQSLYGQDIEFKSRQYSATNVVTHTPPKDLPDPPTSQNAQIPKPADIPKEEFIQNRSISGIPQNKNFTNFVVGNCNRFAHAAALAVAEKLGENNYNPLYIYGSTGLGKTHLLYAIANHVVTKDPTIEPLYVSTEFFTNDMILHLQRKQMNLFKLKYRNLNTKLLLMDDIQFISGKERTQEELFHTFEELKNNGIQIVFTSDVLPKDIDGLSERLRTRFESGMLADCQPPDIETMQAIIAQKSNSQQVFIPQNVSAFIASGVPNGNVREVEGIVNRLVERSKLEKMPITLQFAKTHLQGIITESIDIRLDVKTILQSISNTFNVSLSDLQSENRSKRMSHPRQIAMYFLREYTNLSTTDIAKELKKNHSTVVYGVQRIQKELETDTNLQQTINLIKRDLQIMI